MDEEELRQAQEELHLLRQLTSHSGWVWLEKVAKAQVENRFNDLILTEPQGQDDLIRKTYAAGECAGLKMIYRLPELRMAELQEAIEMEMDKRRLDDEQRDRTDAGNSG